MTTQASAGGTSPRRVAVLCCKSTSEYKQMPNVECYDEDRDVRTFAGGMPVVAHPPCRSWSAFCRHQAKPEPGEKELGPLCANWIRKCGGVLEHPAHSHLWSAADLPRPGTIRGSLWSVEVWQCWWGYPLGIKRTWLCFAGIKPADVHYPFLLRAQGGDKRAWSVGSTSWRDRTTREFAEWLVATARQSHVDERNPPI
jgi:hypothetical protein